MTAPALPMPLQLLRDPEEIDRSVSDPEGASSMLTQLVLLTIAGFAGHALLVGLLEGIDGGDGLRTGIAWFGALTGGFFAAICAGLPSFWFYGVVARIPAPAWRLAVELVRVQAVGSVMLAAVLPFWLVLHLAVVCASGEAPDSVLWTALTWSMPLAAALPGVVGLHKGFVRMREAIGIEGRSAPLLLTLWWAAMFQVTALPTVYALFHAWR